MLGQIYSSLGEIEKGYLCFLDSLEIIWLSGMANVDFKKVLACMMNIVQTATGMVPLADKISDQSNFLTKIFV